MFKYIESHKDFSIFGQFIASDASNIKKNASQKSISPLKKDERSILQKSRSSRFGMQEEESVGRTHKTYNKYQNDTLHNASASVLSNMNFGLKSFVSNRPEFSNVRNDTNMNVIKNIWNFAIFFKFLLLQQQDYKSTVRDKSNKSNNRTKYEDGFDRSKVESFGFNQVVYRRWKILFKNYSYH